MIGAIISLNVLTLAVITAIYALDMQQWLSAAARRAKARVVDAAPCA